MSQNYVSVPVPAELVPELYAWIAERTAKLPAQSPATPGGAPFSTAGWTKQEIVSAIKGASPTMRKMWRALAESPGHEMSLDMLADRTGVARASFKGYLSGYGRYHNAHWKGRPWFFQWVWRDGLAWYSVTTTVALTILETLGDMDDKS